MPSILLVEDNVSLAEVMVRDLRAQGFGAVHVAGGQDALAALAGRAFDVMILDWMLPDLDGLAVLRRLQEARLAIPVLMLTARADEVDRVIGLEVGADDYLTKPFSMRELVARLHALLRRIEKTRQALSSGPQDPPTTLHWREVVVELESHRVFVQGREIDLTPIEFDLLSLFVRHPGCIFNRGYLLETVWEQSHVPGDRSVDNAILRLRRKIAPFGDEIEAVWGVGYRLRSQT